MSNSLQEQFTNFKEQVKSLREQLTRIGELFMTEYFKKIFDKYPALETISWTAYTPYFNDGETCKYRSHHNWAEIEGEGLKHGEEDYQKVEAEVEEFLAQFDDDIMYELFGDHVQIVVTKNGISVEEYEHD